MRTSYVTRGIRHIVFSSTAAACSSSPLIPITEDVPTEPIKLYGASTHVTEWILRDMALGAHAPTKVTGGCLCGTVKYDAEGYLGSGYYCHCRMCQRTSGAPAEIAVPVKPGMLRFTASEPKFYRSSAFAEREFCPQCGARIIYRPISAKFAEYTNLAVGCLDHPENVVPAGESCL